MSKATHLRFNLYGSPDEHPQVVMKQLGITYQHATPQSIADQWWFWNCENIPDPLPVYITILDVNPFDAIGHGLSVEDALRIWFNNEPSKNLILDEEQAEEILIDSLKRKGIWDKLETLTIGGKKIK